MKKPVHHACLVDGKFICSSYRQAVIGTEPVLDEQKEGELEKRGRIFKRGWREFKQKGRVTIREHEYKAIENGQSLGDLLADVLALDNQRRRT